jgi:hypothetical protein
MLLDVLLRVCWPNLEECYEGHRMTPSTFMGERINLQNVGHVAHVVEFQFKTIFPSSLQLNVGDLKPRETFDCNSMVYSGVK